MPVFKKKGNLSTKNFRKREIEGGGEDLKITEEIGLNTEQNDKMLEEVNSSVAKTENTA